MTPEEDHVNKSDSKEIAKKMKKSSPKITKNKNIFLQFPERLFF